jgi:hypothetical protein
MGTEKLSDHRRVPFREPRLVVHRSVDRLVTWIRVIGIGERPAIQTRPAPKSSMSRWPSSTRRANMYRCTNRRAILRTTRKGDKEGDGHFCSLRRRKRGRRRRGVAPSTLPLVAPSFVPVPAGPRADPPVHFGPPCRSIARASKYVGRNDVTASSA